jgi:hypothetical protein
VFERDPQRTTDAFAQKKAKPIFDDFFKWLSKKASCTEKPPWKGRNLYTQID